MKYDKYFTSATFNFLFLQIYWTTNESNHGSFLSTNAILKFLTRSKTVEKVISHCGSEELFFHALPNYFLKYLSVLSFSLFLFCKPREVKDIRDFLKLTKREDAVDVKIKSLKKSGGRKFKIRCSRYLFTLVVADPNKADKLSQSLPPGTYNLFLRFPTLSLSV